MTISSTTRIAGPFLSGTALPYTFKVFAAADLNVVRLNTSTGVETSLVLGSDYTVALNGNQNTNPGGTVNLTVAASATSTVTITSDIANLQPTDLTNQGGFYPEVITDSLDRATIQIQQISDIGDRAIRIPLSDGNLNMELPTAAQRANAFLAFDANGVPTAVVSGSTGAPTTITRQVFSGTGSQTVFTLASDPGALGNSAQVYIGGVYQQRSTYTIGGTTLTFSSAPVAGTDNIEFVNFLTSNIGATSADLVTYTPTGTSAVARSAASKFGDTVSVKDFGAKGDAVTDDTAAIQAAINYLEQQSGGGGIAFVPRGQYRCTNKIRIGSFVTLRGENNYSSSLFWDSTYTSGNCIELGPNQSGTGASTYVFGARLENLYLIGQNVDRGATAAMVYTQGAHQFSGLFNVWINNFRNVGVYYDQGLGGPACFQLYGVELQGSATAPASGSTIGIWANGAGAVIDAQMVLCQGAPSNPMSSGIRMTKDNLNLSGGHFEYCTIGINLEQNETSICTNGIHGVTGHNSVATLIDVDATSNLSYSISHTSNVTIAAVTLTLLADNKNGITLSAFNGTSVGSMSSDMVSSVQAKCFGTSIGSGGANRGMISARNPTNTHQINVGVDTATSAWIQGWQPGTGSWDVSVNPGGGNVGIGTASPAKVLHCNGAMRYTTRPAAAVVTNIGVDANGDVREATSSSRYKHNIVPYTKGLSEVLALEPKQFSYNGEELLNAGFIAEDVEQLNLPEYVIRDADGLAHAIPYGNMVALLTNAIKELSARLSALEGQ